MQLRPLVLALCFLPTLGVGRAHAQVHLDWLQTLDAAPAGLDRIIAVRTDASGAVVASGRTGARDLLLAKYDAAGSLAWSRTFDLAGGEDYGAVPAIDPASGAVYVVGCGESSNALGLAQKYDAGGTLLWTATYGPASGGAVFDAAALTPSGNLVAAASLQQGGSTLVEYDPAGNLLWSADEPQCAFPSALAFDSNGDILVTGAYSGPDGIGVTRFSASGAHLWTRVFPGGGGGFQIAYALVVEASGSTYLGGRTSAAAGAAVEALLKIDAAGNLLWSTTLHGTQAGASSGSEWLGALMLEANGNVLAAGVCANQGSGADLRALECTPAGQIAWQSSWNGPANGFDNCLAAGLGADGTLTILSGTESGPGAFDPAVVRWDAHGNFVGADVVDLSALGGTLATGAFGPDGARIFAGRAPVSAPSDALVLAVSEQSISICFGDGSSGPCPCGNSSAPGEGRGCGNSVGTAARLTSSGLASLGADALMLLSVGEPAGANALFLQGDSAGAQVLLGDGIRCLSGTLRRMFVHACVGGSVLAPSGMDPSVSARSAALGDVIAPGSRRSYQVLYRDPAAGFCPPPLGGGTNLSSALSVLWVP